MYSSTNNRYQKSNQYIIVRNNDLGCIAVPFILIAKLLEFIGKILVYILFIPCIFVALLLSIFTGKDMEDIFKRWGL